MAPRLAELCNLLIAEKLGDAAAIVFTTLARHGRLPFPELRYRTTLPVLQLQDAILMLANHHILLWHQADEYDHVYYQVDWHAAYVLVRQRKISRLVETRHGKVARQLLADILERGTEKVGDLEGNQHFEPASPRDSGIGMMDDQASEDDTDGGNGHGCGFDVKAAGDDAITTVASFHDALRTLLADGFLSKVTPRDHIPTNELEDQLRIEVITANPRVFKDGKTTGPKTAGEFAKAANELKRKWHDEAEYSPHHDVAARGTIKRSKGSVTISNKRRKMSHIATDGFPDIENEADEHEVEITGSEYSARKLPRDMRLRVNYNKCMIALRTTRLENLAEQHLSSTTAKVYSAVLRAAEDKTRSVRRVLRQNKEVDSDDDDDGGGDGGGDGVIGEATVTVTDAELLDRLQKDLDLASAIKGASELFRPQAYDDTPKKGKKRRLIADEEEEEEEDGIAKEIDSDEDIEPMVNGCESPEQRQKRQNLISMHLDLVGEASKKFLQRDEEKHTSSINFGTLSKMLTNAEIDSMILARGGDIGLRVIRILREKGKLLDTQIATMALRRLKDLRAVLGALQNLGFIDVQEVPKDASRQPSRTLYLWQYDEHNVRQMFLQQSYQGLSNTITRLHAEELRNAAILGKAEDVGWDMKKLNKPERDMLAHWQATEERLKNTINDLDDVVTVLRDFDETDTSLLT